MTYSIKIVMQEIKQRFRFHASSVKAGLYSIKRRWSDGDKCHMVCDRTAEQFHTPKRWLRSILIRS